MLDHEAVLKRIVAEQVRVEREMIAGPVRLACYRVLDPVKGEWSSRQFHMTYDNYVVAVMQEASAKLFASFINSTFAKDVQTNEQS